MNNFRCPFDFTTNCSKVCSWYDKRQKGCRIPLVLSDLIKSVDYNSEILKGVAVSLKTIISKGETK